MSMIDEVRTLLQDIVSPQLRAIEARLGDIDKQLSKIDGRLDYLVTRVDRIEADLREFYRVLGIHDAKIENLEKGGAQ